MRTEPLLDFSYTEVNGVLYPDIMLDNAGIGKFGQTWKAFMRANAPERLSELLIQGVLHSTMKQVDAAAEDYKENLVRTLMKGDPLPQTEDVLARAAHMETLTRIADELTLHEFVLQIR